MSIPGAEEMEETTAIIPTSLLAQWVMARKAELLPRSRVRLSPSILVELTGQYFNEDDHYHDEEWVFPTEFNVPAVVEYLGFTEEASKAMFDIWEKDVKGKMPFDLEQTVVSMTCSSHTILAGDDDEGWREQLTLLGFNEKFIGWQMDPCLKQFRGLASVEDWLRDILETRASALERLRKLCWEAAARTSMWVTTTPTQGHGQEPLSATTSTSRDEQGQTLQQNLNEDGTISPFLTVKDIMHGDDEGIPGFISLFKGCCQGEATQLIQDNTSIDMELNTLTARLALDSLTTNTANDFSPGKALYFTTQRWVAVEYAKMSARRVHTDPLRPPVIIQIIVPNAAFTLMQLRRIPFGDLWKKVIWACRRRSPPQDWPEGVKEQVRNQIFVTGPICGQHNKAFSSCASWEGVKDSWVMKSSSGEVSSQHAFGSSTIVTLANYVPLSHMRVIQEGDWRRWNED